MWNRDVVIINQMELTAAMAVREKDPDSTADRSSDSDSSDSEVVSFPVVVLFLPTNTTHFKKNTNKISIRTWWRANAPSLCLIFNLINSWTPWSLQLRVFLIPRCLSAQGVRMFCLRHRTLTESGILEKKNLSHVGEFDTLLENCSSLNFFPS